jgi:hypothetical protein
MIIFGFPHPDPSQIGGYMVMVISYGLEKINNRHITLNPKPLFYSLVAFVTNEGAV